MLYTYHIIAFCYNWGDHGCPPSKTPFLLQAGLISHYIKYGAYYPRGGTSSIAKKIIPTILDAGGGGGGGGMVVTNAPVKHVVVNRWGRATGVELEKDGRRYIQAKEGVISDIGYIPTLTKLLPPNLPILRHQLIEKILGPECCHDKVKEKDDDGKLHGGISGMYLFVGLKNNDVTLPKKATQYWVNGTATDMYTEDGMDKLRNMTLEDSLFSSSETTLQPKDLFLFIGSPSNKDKDWKKDPKFQDKSTLEIITFVPNSWFEEFADESSRSGSDNKHGCFKYNRAKKLLADKMWQRTVEVLSSMSEGGATSSSLPPTLEDVDHYQIGTPLTFEHYYQRGKTNCGSFYGVCNDRNGKFAPEMYYHYIRPDGLCGDVSNLYLTGQDVNYPGFVGAMIGGLVCASKVSGCYNPMNLLVVQEDEAEE